MTMMMTARFAVHASILRLAALGIAASITAFAGAPARGETPAEALEAPAGEAFQQDVAWSPDGRSIAFSEYTGGADYKPEKWSVQVIATDGSDRRVLVNNALGASWSPDGTKLAFGSMRDGNWEIYTIRTDGSRLRRLTADEGTDHLPAWSPRGDRIAFCSSRDGNEEIYLMTQDGTGPTRLTKDPAKDFNPAWSRDATQLVFYREKGDGKDQIHVVAADGSKEQAITADDANNVFPSFLPDGKIVFISKPKGGPETLVRVAADGTGREPIGVPGIFFARWSPGGRHVAFIAGAWPKSAIYLMNADGTQIRKLVN